MLFKDVYIPRGWVQEMEVDRSVKKGEEMILSVLAPSKACSNSLHKALKQQMETYGPRLKIQGTSG